MKARGISKDVYGNTDWLVPVQDLRTPEILLDRISEIDAIHNKLRKLLEKSTKDQLLYATRCMEKVKTLM